MAKRAKSALLQKREESARKASQLELATQMYKIELTKPPEARTSLRSFAKQFPGVSYATLWRRAQGKQSMQDFNASKQKLTRAEEEILVQLIEISAGQNNPLTYKDIARHACEIIRMREGDGSIAIGVNWVYRFLVRQHDRLQIYLSKGLDTQWAQSFNEAKAKHWFDSLTREVVDEEIYDRNIYMEWM